MSKLSHTPPAHKSEQSTPTGSSKITRWSRLAVFASALSATSACAPASTQTTPMQPEYPGTTQAQQPTPQPEIIATQVPTTARIPKSPDTQAEKNNDPEAMLAAVISDPMLLNKTDPALKNNRDFMKSGLERTSDPSVFVQLSPEWVRQDAEMMMIAGKRNIALLQFADKSLTSNMEFMLQMVEINGLASQYADENLRKNKNFMMTAVRQNPTAYQYSHETLKTDGNFLLFALSQPISNDFVSPLKSAIPKFQKNRLVVIIALRQDARALEYADSIHQKDKSIAVPACLEDEFVLEFVHPSIREAVRKEVQAKKGNKYKSGNYLPKDIPEPDDGGPPRVEPIRMPK